MRKIHRNKVVRVLEEFHRHFKTIVEVVIVKAQEKHDADMFRKVCLNMKDDLANLDICTKELRRYIHEGK